MNVALGVLMLGLNEPVPPLTTVHVPVPLVGPLPPSPAVVPPEHIVWLPPTLAVVGGWLIVTLNCAVESAQGGFEIVHLRTIGPFPVRCVNVAPGVLAFGLNDPVPPLTTVHIPVPTLGVLPPSPVVVPNAHIV